jgi:hypothetical protein
LKWVVIAVFLGITGLSYVYLSNTMHNNGSEISKIEKDNSRLKVLIEEAQAKITQLSSRTVLQRRLNEGFIKMVAITDDRIVRINAPQHSANEIRAVANRGMEK